jgi:RNA polymerase sigma factor (sigma-70 family)
MGKFFPPEMAKLFSEMYPKMCVTAEGILKDEEQAKDKVMETFDKALEVERTKGFENASHAKGFLIITVRNACIDFLRAQRRVTENLRNLSVEVEQKTDMETIEAEVEKAVRLQKVLDVIDSFPRQMKKILLLYLLEDKTLEEISVQLGIALKTARNTFYKGKERLRKKFPNKNLFKD